MLEAFDLTGSLRDAAELAGCSHHTVGRYVRARDAGGASDRAAARPQLADEFWPKLEEWMERSKGKIRADVAHDKLAGAGLPGVGADDPAGGRAGAGGVSGRGGCGCTGRG